MSDSETGLVEDCSMNVDVEVDIRYLSEDENAVKQ